MAAYRAIAQGEHDEFSDPGTDSALMSSPYVPVDQSLTPLSADLSPSNNVSAFRPHALRSSPSPDKSDKENGKTYDMFDEGDEWVSGPRGLPPIPSGVEPDLSSPQGVMSDYGIKPSHSPEPLVRSNSTLGKANIRHPKAGLETIQGAYLGNVKTLEESADQMSQALDLGGEIRKKVDEQKRSDSLLSSKGQDDSSQVSEAIRRLSLSISRKSSNASLAARSRNMSFTSVLNEHIQHANSLWSDGEMRQSVLSPLSPGRNPPPTSNLVKSPSMGDLPLPGPIGDADRPTTAASTDTTQQARFLFSDFDGVHNNYAPSEAETREKVRMSTMNNKFARPVAPIAPPNSVFYPAPIPAQLNIPQRISRQAPPSARDMRKSQFIAEITQQNQSRTSFLPEVSEQAEEEAKPESPVKAQRASTLSFGYLHPAARASAFFEKPVSRPDIELQDDSAVKTLDTILHASASAPVDAFVGHPIVGRIGSEVYGRDQSRKSSAELGDKDKHKSRRTTSLLNIGDVLMRRRTKLMEEKSESSEAEEEESENGSFLPGSGTHQTGEEKENEVGEDGEPIDPASIDYIGKPTTLLAELQLRKQQQKLRTRTAATAFPGGMHSTLLEMDAVAQRQKEARKQRQVTLAWEDPALEAEREEDEDEDVPLGLILARNHNNVIAHAGVRAAQDFTIPYGLREQREFDDNEPLARRRERILAEHGSRAQTMGNLEPPALDEPEEETLAQRIKRLKGQGGSTTMLDGIQPTSDFSELKSQLGLESESQDAKSAAAALPTQTEQPVNEEEETLAQRRRRLQAEEAARSQQQPPQPQLRQQVSFSNSTVLPTQSAVFNPYDPSTLMQQQQQDLWQRQSVYARDFLPQSTARAKTMMGYPHVQSHLQARSFSNGLYNTGFGAAAALPGFQLPVRDSTLNSSSVWAVETVVPESRKLERVEKWRSEVVP